MHLRRGSAPNPAGELTALTQTLAVVLRDSFAMKEKGAEREEKKSMKKNGWKEIKTRSSLGDEIANVSCFMTTSYTYYKVQ